MTEHIGLIERLEASRQHEQALPPLQAPCHGVPLVAQARAMLLRAQVMRRCAQTAPDARALHALRLVCAQHPQAQWWLDHQQDAHMQIASAQQRLLHVRGQAETKREALKECLS